MGDEKKIEDLEDVDDAKIADPLEDADGGAKTQGSTVADPLEDADGGFGKHTMDGT